MSNLNIFVRTYMCFSQIQQSIQLLKIKESSLPIQKQKAMSMYLIRLWSLIM